MQKRVNGINLKHHEIQQLKQAQAQQRAEERSKRTPRQQLNVLNKRLGKGEGATRERARLDAQIKQANAEKKALAKKEEK